MVGTLFLQKLSTPDKRQNKYLQRFGFEALNSSVLMELERSSGGNQPAKSRRAIKSDNSLSEMYTCEQVPHPLPKLEICASF